ncbi:MAG: hypothetical protein QXU32_12305 [Nitrososphaerales archaeon]
MGEWHHAFDERPLGVTVLAILYFINAAIAFTGIAVFAYLASEMDFLEPYPLPGEAFAQPMVTTSFVSAIMVAVGIVLGVIGAINLLIGFGLLQGRKWARNLAIAFAIINIIFYSLSIPATFGASLAMVFFNGFILWYLYRAHVIAYFRR